MRIKKIQITAFGKLKNFELCIDDKLNLVYGDNEAGKSTVMAFIKMALYGSTVRGGGLLNPRVKYLPFDGSAMGGFLYLEHNRINYRLDCKFGSTPAKDKIALYNDDTGDLINLGATETVGEYFFNLSGATFESTAFIQNITPSGGADEIVKLLSANGSSDDGSSPELVKKRLAAAKDGQFTKRRVGAGDKLADEIEAARRMLLAEKERAKILNDTKASILQKEAEVERLKGRKQQLVTLVNAAGNIRRRDQLNEFIEICKAKNELKAKCGGATAEFVEACKKRLWDYEQLSSAAKQSLNDYNTALASIEATDQDHANEILQNARLKLQQLENTPVKTKSSKKVLLICGIITLLLGILLGLIHPAAFGVSAVGIILTILGITTKEAKTSAENIQQEKIKLLLVVEGASRVIEAAKVKDRTSKEQAAAADSLLCDLKKLDATATLQNAKSTLEQFAALLSQLQDKTSSHSALSQALAVSYEQAAAELSAMPQTEITEKQINYAKAELSTIDNTLTDLVKAIAALNERVCAVSSHKGAAELERDIAEMERQLCARTDFAKACDIASDVLADAYSELRQSFGPQLNQKTAKLFEKLTNGRYNQIKVAHDLTITAGKQGSFSLIDADYLSAGTTDQAYISLRLAIAGLLAEGSLPVFLDDAFLQFDLSREKQAFSLLDELSDHQQFIYFTCRKDTLELAKQVKATVITL